MGFSRMFRGSFGSCRTGKLSDVVEKSVFLPQTQKEYFHFHSMERLPPKVRTFTGICRPNCPENTTNAITNSIFLRQNGNTCPPASPDPPFNSFCKEFGFYQKKKKSSSSSAKNKKKKKIKCNTRREISFFNSSSQDFAYFNGSYWFSSEEEEEGESDTLFSSRNHSTDSPGSHIHRRHRSLRREKHSTSLRRSRTSSKSSEMGVLPFHGKVKDSFAVVKSSSDPYNDFRTSMVEMIVEKQIFSAKDLEQLLQCFLSLNSDNHHRIIMEVFTDIWETLFSNWS